MIVGHLPIGTILDQRYRLEAVLGEGAMGVVYRATHLGIGKAVAVKVLRSEQLVAAEALRRFMLEARLAATLEHPNIVTITDCRQLPEGGAYYSMELLRGQSLGQRLAEAGRLSIAEACSIALQITAGLERAHGAGVVHRDLKPDNVFLASPKAADGPVQVKLLDFGIARAGGRVTAVGMILGTPDYMSPEMASGREVDGRADLYAVGVMMFQMLAGRLPFDGPDVVDVLRAKLVTPPPRLGAYVPEVAAQPRLERLVGSLMAIDPAHRPADARSVLAELRELGGLAPGVAPVRPPSRTQVVRLVVPTRGRIAAGEPEFVGATHRLAVGVGEPVNATHGRIAAGEPEFVGATHRLAATQARVSAGEPEFVGATQRLAAVGDPWRRAAVGVGLALLGAAFAVILRWPGSSETNGPHLASTDAAEQPGAARSAAVVGGSVAAGLGSAPVATTSRSATPIGDVAEAQDPGIVTTPVPDELPTDRPAKPATGVTPHPSDVAPGASPRRPRSRLPRPPGAGRRGPTDLKDPFPRGRR